MVDKIPPGSAQVGQYETQLHLIGLENIQQSKIEGLEVEKVPIW